MKKCLVFFTLTTAIFFTAIPAKAVSWFPIVPCGLNQQPAGATRQDYDANGKPTGLHDYTQPCNQCLLVELGKNIIDMTFFAIVPSVGTLLFMIAGFIILFNARSGNANGVTKGKEIMTNTAIGIAIVLSAWLITNFILKSIGTDQVSGVPWYTIQCRVSNLKDLTDATLPSVGGTTGGGTTGGTDGTGTQYNCSSSATCLALPAGEVGTYSGSTALSDCKEQCEGITPPGSGGGSGGTLACTFNGVDYATVNLCSGLPRPGGCGTATCSQYLPAVTQYANGAATAQVLKTFMVIESDCNTNAGTGTSYGLMQLTPTSVAPFAYQCPGASSTGITSAWLKANPALSVCLAAAYINGVSAKCGSDLAHLYAGYNGNAVTACAQSVSCRGTNSCSGGPIEQWECPYNNTQHTSCNTGYYQTKQGGMYVNYCKNNLGF